MAGGALLASAPASCRSHFGFGSCASRTCCTALSAAQRQWFIAFLLVASVHPPELHLASLGAHDGQPWASLRTGGPMGDAASTPWNSSHCSGDAHPGGTVPVPILQLGKLNWINSPVTQIWCFTDITTRKNTSWRIKEKGNRSSWNVFQRLTFWKAVLENVLSLSVTSWLESRGRHSRIKLLFCDTVWGEDAQVFYHLLLPATGILYKGRCKENK